MKSLSPLIAALCLCMATTEALGETLAGGAMGQGATAFDDMPPEAMQAFRRYYFDDMGGPAGCRGMTAEAAILAIGPLFRTDYNADGAPDFIFQSPCESSSAARENGRLLVSDPFGYHVARNFAASVGRLNGETVLMVTGDCPQTEAPFQDQVEAGVCYFGRRWNSVRNRWGAVEDLSRLALAAGPSAPAKPVAVAPLAAPPPPAAKPPVPKPAKPPAPKPTPAKPPAAKPQPAHEGH